jgi:transposase
MSSKIKGKEGIMPKKRRVSMRKAKEILRLHYEQGLSNRAIARACNISPTTVYEDLDRASRAKLDFATLSAMDDESLGRILYPEKAQRKSSKQMPDMAYLHKELKRKGVSLQLLWEEYKAAHPDGYNRSQFYYRYKEWSKGLNPVMRMNHKAGEKMFVDFSGDKPYYIAPGTGEMIDAELFIAVLGASSYTFAQAVRSQRMEDWIRCHIEAFEYLGGCPEVIVPDNLKAGVKTACFYDPQINPVYAEMADHYGVAVLPTRPYKARDKAKVENGVLNVQRRILAAIRNLRFFSLLDLNEGIKEALGKLNTRPMKGLNKSRYELFTEIDKPALRPLPQKRFELFTFKLAKVHIDYHIEVEKSYYSVPYKLLHKKVEVKYNDHTVEVYHNGRRVASHLRTFEKGKYITDDAHRPPEHLKYLEWTPERIRHWGKSIGENTEHLMERIMSSRRHVEHGYRTCLGILRLSKRYSPQRLENACKRALFIGGISYRSVKSILENNLDKEEMTEAISSSKCIIHENIRGGGYYQGVGHV